MSADIVNGTQDHLDHLLRFLLGGFSGGSKVSGFGASRIIIESPSDAAISALHENVSPFLKVLRNLPKSTGRSLEAAIT